MTLSRLAIQQIPANVVQLRQVIVNLVANATDAMSAVADRARLLSLKTGIYDPDSLLLTVEDTGTGIDPDIAERIFEPFFTTKSYGMGMGLSICRSIVESHGWRLSVSAARPQGSIFSLFLRTGAAPQ